MDRVRASPEQISTLLEYMETHGDLSRPLAGAQGRIRSDRLWAELTALLNAVGGGVNKTTDKWKKMWADWKSKTKKKGLSIRRHSGGTGGGPVSRQTLSVMEERLLAVMGELAVEGQASVDELGFNTSQSPVPNTYTLEDTEYLGILDETSHLPSPQPSTSQQPSTSRQTPPPPPRLLMLATSQQPSTSRQTPPPRLLMRAPRSAQGWQPAALSPTAPLSPPAPPAAAAPATPRRRRARSPTTPQAAGSPVRPRARPRRRRLAPTPFERAATEFTAVESRRLDLEETRMRLQHARDMRALEIDHERNQVFQAVVGVARDWLEYFRSRADTEPLNTE